MEPRSGASLVVERAVPGDESGIQRVCSRGWRATYEALYPSAYVERVVEDFYGLERLEREVAAAVPPEGYRVVRDREGRVLGAGGGGLTAPGVGEVFVLYVDPHRLYEGIGTRLLAALTREQVAYGAREQWVSVAKGNEKGVAILSCPRLRPRSRAAGELRNHAAAVPPSTSRG